MKTRREEDGFTLVELLTVVAMVSALTLIAIPVLTGMLERAYRAAVVSDLRNAAISLSEYQARNGRYPLAGEVPLQTSSGVTVTVANPAVLAETTWFCLEGEHDKIDSGVVGTFDTRAGGLTSNTTC